MHRFIIPLLLLPIPALAQDAATDCDRLAGYLHTPRLPGLGGALTLDDPAPAIAACTAALAAEGSDPFLNFLLARALGAADPQDPRLPGLIAAGAAASAPFAASRLSLLYIEGHGGLAQDPDRAQALARESCDAYPDPRALVGCNNLAVDLIEAGANDEAFALFERACEGGFSLSCGNLADHFWAGTYPAADMTRLVALLGQGCAAGDPFACVQAGYALERGDGGTQNIDAANALYLQGCEAGELWGCYALGYNILHELGLPYDRARGMAFLRRGCTDESVDACNDLALQLMEGPPEEVAEGIAQFRRLCGVDFAAACTELGRILRAGEAVPRDVDQALTFNRRGCDLGDAMGCNNLGVHYGLGEGVERDLGRAFRLYSEACEQGVGLGCYNVGFTLAGEDLGPPDPEAARAAYRRGCDLGQPDACAALDE